MFERKAKQVTAEFPCAGCGQVAARVSLLPPGVVDRSPFDDSAPPGFETIGSDRVRVSIALGPHPCSHWPITKDAIPTIRKALATGDPKLLASVDPEYANFYCPKCDACYCKDHWAVQAYYDEGFYDCTYGTCPKEHRIKIDD